MDQKIEEFLNQKIADKQQEHLNIEQDYNLMTAQSQAQMQIPKHIQIIQKSCPKSFKAQKARARSSHHQRQYLTFTKIYQNQVVPAESQAMSRNKSAQKSHEDIMHRNRNSPSKNAAQFSRCKTQLQSQAILKSKQPQSAERDFVRQNIKECGQLGRNNNLQKTPIQALDDEHDYRSNIHTTQTNEYTAQNSRGKSAKFRNIRNRTATQVSSNKNQSHALKDHGLFLANQEAGAKINEQLKAPGTVKQPKESKQSTITPKPLSPMANPIVQVSSSREQRFKRSSQSSSVYRSPARINASFKKAIFLKMLNEHKQRQYDLAERFQQVLQQVEQEEDADEAHQKLSQLNRNLQQQKKQLFEYNDFQIGLRLGQGAFAVVRRCVHKRTGHIIALKTYEKKNLQHSTQSSALHSEIFYLAHLEHPNIMQLHEVVDTRTQVHLVMEYCEGKSLYHLIKKSREKKSPGIPEDQVRAIFYQVASALAYMHSVDIVHRDLKLDNILINSGGKIKLIDFGFATKCKINERLTAYCGTPHYMDPDLAKKNPYIGGAADVWALGVILFVLLTGKLPFFAEFEADLFRKIIGAKYQFPKDLNQLRFQNKIDEVSNGAKALIRKIFEPNPITRITAAQILKEPWLKGVRPEEHYRSDQYAEGDLMQQFQILHKANYSSAGQENVGSLGSMSDPQLAALHGSGSNENVENLHRQYE